MAAYDYEIIRGAKFELPFRFTQRIDAALINISTWEFSAEFVAEPGGATLLAATTAGGQFANDANVPSRTRLKFTAAETAAFPLGKIQADVFRTDAADGDKRLFWITLPVRDKV